MAEARRRPQPVSGAPFLLVDEPTSALDPHAEIAAFEGLWALAGSYWGIILNTEKESMLAIPGLVPTALRYTSCTPLVVVMGTVWLR